MISSAEQRLRDAIDALLAEGASPEAITTMAGSILDTSEGSGSRPPSSTPDAGEVIYDELPDDLIDVPTAVREYGISRSTLSTWRRQGKLHRRGRLRAAAPGGGYNVFSREDVLGLISAPVNKGGRPKKLPHTV